MEPFMSMTSMNVSLPEELKEYVEAQTKSGYSTPSEYVRELIREDQKRRAKAKLDALLLEGLNSGDPVPMDAKFWAELKQEALSKLASRGKARRK
jgi:antitoxin ParD1/3/4